MIIRNTIKTAETDQDLLNRLSNLESYTLNNVENIYSSYIRGIKAWQYQDFSSPVSTNLVITGFFNGSGMPFASGYILDSSAVITKSDNTEKVPTNTNNIITQYLPSNRVKVTTHTQVNVTLNQSPAVGQDCRVWFLININSGVPLPSGYQEAPQFVREERVAFLDSTYVNQYDDETIYGIKTLDSAPVFTNKSQTRANLDILSAALQESEYFAAFYELTGVSGVLNDKIQASDAGVSTINNLSGFVNIQSSYQTVKIQNTGNTLNIELNPNNTQIHRDGSNNITGIYYNNNIGRIMRDNGQISGVIFNNYTKRILRNENNQITGVQIINN